MVGAELTLGLIGLPGAFKGALDSFLFVKSFFDTEEESGLRDLALHYHVQCAAFRDWGDRHNIFAEHPRDCDLIHEKHQTKILILEIFERMKKLQDDGEEYIKAHDASMQSRDGPQLDAADFVRRLEEATTVSKQRSQKKHKKRMKWVIINKAKFTEVVKQMENCNQGLDNLLTPRTQIASDTTLPGQILAPLDNLGDLESLMGIMGPSKFIVSHVTKLKRLELSSDSNDASIRIVMARSDIIIDSTYPETGKSQGDPSSAHACDLGSHVHGQRIWVEWKVINEGFTEAQTMKLINRVRTLGEMLSAESTMVLRTAQCIGVIQDEADRLRYGLVFRPPEQYGSTTTPVTLQQIIQNSGWSSGKPNPGWMSEPPLGHKFELARHLASSLVLFHASRWLHKAFRSDNILFFGGTNEHATVLDPYVAGFENSRHHQEESLGHRPTGSGPFDYFYHPDAADGFSKTMDMYSFGVVLLEIAMWRPLGQQLGKARGSLKLIQERFLKSTRLMLPGRVGSIYAGVVERCLKCDFPEESADEFVSAVSTGIISQLDKCCA